MKIKLLLLAVILPFIVQKADAQIAYNKKIDSLINQVFNSEALMLYDKELSGEVSTTIGGSAYTIKSRHANQPGNDKAAQYILEKFQSFGLSARYNNYSSTGKNILATKTGTKYPEKQFIICGHYDAMPSGTTNYGADDNASGTSAVMEAARVLANFPLEYSVVFIAFDEEEIGLVGSEAYADSAAIRGDQILGVLNLDMIAWDSDNDFKLHVITNNASSDLADLFISGCNVYTPEIVTKKKFDNVANSDHAPFWPKGYKAFLAIEDLSDFNPYYHTLNDKFSTLNQPFFISVTKAAIATLTALATDCKISISHDALPSGLYTENRMAKFVVKTTKTIATGVNSPKLYYSINDEAYTVLNATSTSGDTLTYIIPAQNNGSKVKYYIAVQDQEANIVATLPSGGKGFNLPGNIAPNNVFMYYISSKEFCSSKSVAIPDKVVVYDSIYCAIDSTISDLNIKLDVTHTYVDDIEAKIIAPGGEEVQLFSYIGDSGDNYTNTVFDQQASTLISDGTAPFTGFFKPVGNLTSLNGKSSKGFWKIRFYDRTSSDVGTLNSWCLQFTFPNTGVNIQENYLSKENTIKVFPNPTKDITNISINCVEVSTVSIDIFDISGRKIESLTNESYEIGTHSIQWNTTNFENGVYFAKVSIKNTANTTSKAIKIMVQK